MKKIFAIVLLSVVMLSVMIVPSFADTYQVDQTQILDLLEEDINIYFIKSYYNSPAGTVEEYFNAIRSALYQTNDFFCLVSCIDRFYSNCFFEDATISIMYNTITNSVEGFKIDEELYSLDFFNYGMLILLTPKNIESDYFVKGYKSLIDQDIRYSLNADFLNEYSGDSMMFLPYANLGELEEIIPFYYGYSLRKGSDGFLSLNFVIPESDDLRFASLSVQSVEDDVAQNVFFEFNFPYIFYTDTELLNLFVVPPPPPIVIEETGNVFSSVISWAGSFVNTVFNNTGLLILFLLGVGISIVLVVIRILRKVMRSN